MSNRAIVTAANKGYPEKFDYESNLRDIWTSDKKRNWTIYIFDREIPFWQVHVPIPKERRHSR